MADTPKFFTVFGNNNLKVADGVKLTEHLAELVKMLNNYYVILNMSGVVTSGFRDQKDQLRILIAYSVKYGLPARFSETDVYTLDQDNGLYIWQYNWSWLLNKGVKINPPLEAEVLMDYVRDNGVNMKGKTIKPSPHFKGQSIDIAGLEAAMPVAYAQREHPDIIKDVVHERGNGSAGCTHIDIYLPSEV